MGIILKMQTPRSLIILATILTTIPAIIILTNKQIPIIIMGILITIPIRMPIPFPIRTFIPMRILTHILIPRIRTPVTSHGSSSPFGTWQA